MASISSVRHYLTDDNCPLPLSRLLTRSLVRLREMVLYERKHSPWVFSTMYESCFPIAETLSTLRLRRQIRSTAHWLGYRKRFNSTLFVRLLRNR
jgi:hypothetical protein